MTVSLGTGDICVNENGIVGILTEEDQVVVRRGDDPPAPAFVGVSGLGTPWSSADPVYLGHVQELSGVAPESFDSWCRSKGYSGPPISESQGLVILEAGRKLRLI